MARQKQSLKATEPALQSIHYGKWDGITNAVLRTELKPTDLWAATNFDIDREGFLSTRDGYALQASGDCHSLFAQDSICLMVMNGNLVQINPDLSLTIIRAGVGDNPMSYAFFQGKVYYTNGSVIAYIDNGVSKNFTVPTYKNKMLPIPGNMIAVYHGCLCIVVGDIVYVSDPLHFNSFDVIDGFVKFPLDITMFGPVDGGVWVSTTEKVYFCTGDDFLDSGRTSILTEPAIPGSMVYVDSRLFGTRSEYRQIGKMIVWMSASGMCWGSNDKLFGLITQRKYIPPVGSKGAALFKQGSINQYLCVLY